MGRIRDSIGTALHAISEAVLTLPADQDIDNDDFGGRRITGDNKRDLSEMSHDRQREIAWYLYLTNPQARDFMEKIVDYTVGEGVNVTAPNEEIAGVITRFWDDPTNDMDQRLEQFVRELHYFGELALPVEVNEHTGAAQIGYIDPSGIDQIKKDPGNALIDRHLVMKAAPGETAVTKDIVGPNKDTGLLEGNCFYFPINRASNGTRGNSEMLHLADWFDAYDQFLFATMERASLLNTFIWDVTLEKMGPKQIKQWLKKNRDIKPGMIRAHNEKVKWDSVSPDTKGADASKNAKIFRGQLAAGTGIPEHWMGIGDGANKATASEMNDPPVKRMTRRQNLVRSMIRKMINFAIDAAIEAKYITIPKVEEGPDKGQELKPGSKEWNDWRQFKVIMPDVSAKDVTKVAAALSQATQAMMLAQQNGWTTSDENIELFAMMTAHMGADVDVDKLKTALKDEAEEADDETDVSDEALAAVAELEAEEA